MTDESLVGVAVSTASRQLSRAVFGRPYQLEVAAAAAGLGAGFVVEDLVDAARCAVETANLDPPKESAIRKSLDRLVHAGVIDMLPQSGPGSPAHYTPVAGSAFWSFVAELYDRT